MPIKIRPHALSQIMAEPRSRNEILTVGAKAYIRGLAKQHVYGYTPHVSSKYTEKGLLVEQDSIDLLNSVLFTSYQKNTERRENDWLSGECDIREHSKIIDIKSSWSLATFPATHNDAHDKDYEWQARGYMMLWNKDRANVCYCMVDTPDELIGYEDASIHRVGHIDPALRVTRVEYKRDGELELNIINKVTAAQRYFDEAVELILNSHKG